MKFLLLSLFLRERPKLCNHTGPFVLPLLPLYFLMKKQVYQVKNLLCIFYFCGLCAAA